MRYADKSKTDTDFYWWDDTIQHLADIVYRKMLISGWHAEMFKGNEKLFFESRRAADNFVKETEL